ncbi:RidA family protein [Novosphingobium sp. 1949]|uniref:RidA family protein n=1 Tax=Novosphingobium organovorum TaxID=2930092 RepID=A0ABT0BGF1_9SPHN|nr:RidA family protein [Novosphingobium organovorum]MCJ2184104.1 RidA family protein [Novosphingobium organovorum]
MTVPSSLPLSVTRKAGPFVFVSGQLAIIEGKLADGDVAVQTDLAINAIARHLEPYGLGLGDVVRTGVWLTRTEDFSAFNEAYAARFADPYPTRSTVISGLALSGALVEIEAVALLP